MNRRRPEPDSAVEPITIEWIYWLAAPGDRLALTRTLFEIFDLPEVGR